MILNLLRVEAVKIEEMIKRSFSENATQKMMPINQKSFAEVSLSIVVIFIVTFLTTTQNIVLTYKYVINNRVKTNLAHFKDSSALYVLEI